MNVVSNHLYASNYCFKFIQLAKGMSRLIAGQTQNLLPTSILFQRNDCRCQSYTTLFLCTSLARYHRMVVQRLLYHGPAVFLRHHHTFHRPRTRCSPKPAIWFESPDRASRFRSTYGIWWVVVLCCSLEASVQTFLLQHKCQAGEPAKRNSFARPVSLAPSLSVYS